MRKLAWRAGAASGVLVIGMAGAASGSAAASAGPLTAAGIKTQYDGNAGYGAVPKPGGATSFRYVQASFTVPSANAVSCADGGGETSVVAALGHFDSYGVGEQAGVFINCGSSSATYQAGYLPGTDPDSGSPPDGAFRVSPGDTILASVYYNSATAQYSYYVHDETSGHSLRTTAPCAAGGTCGQGSAQAWASSALDLFQPFSGRLTFSDVEMTDSAGQQGGLASSGWALDRAASNSPDEDPPYGITSPATASGMSSFQVYYQQ